MNGFSPGFRSGFAGALTPPEARQDKLVLSWGQSNVNGGDLVKYLSRVPDAVAFGQNFQPVIQWLSLASNATDTGAVGQPTRDEGVLGPRFLSIRPNVVLGDHSYELSLMRELHRCVPGRWNFAEFAVGGSSMATSWKIAGGTYPVAGPLLANQFITFGQSVCSQIGIAAPDIVTWEQGTTDALAHAQAIAYQTNAQPFINLIRATWPNVKILIKLILTTASGAGADVAAVIAAQNALAVDTTVRAGGRNIDFITVINPEGTGAGQPNATPDHYRSDSLDIIAVQREAPAILSALGLKTKPQAGFRYYGSGLTVTATDLSTKANGTISTWSMDFGDGSSPQTGAGPWSRTYAGAGTYTARLTVVDSDGNTDIFTDTIVVVAAVGWTFDATGDCGTPDTLTEWTALINAANPGSSTCGPPAHHWTFGNSVAPCPDVIGGGAGTVNLNVNAGTLASTDSHMTRKGFLVTTTSTRANNTTTAEDMALVDTFTLCLALPPTANPAAIRDLFGGGGGTSASFRYTTLGRLSVATSATRNSFLSHSGLGVQLFGLQVNNTAGQFTIFSDVECFIIDYALPTTTKNIFAGQFGLTSATGVVYFAMTQFVGANARWTRNEARRIWRALKRNPQW